MKTGKKEKSKTFKTEAISVLISISPRQDGRVLIPLDTSGSIGPAIRAITEEINSIDGLEVVRDLLDQRFEWIIRAEIKTKDTLKTVNARVNKIFLNAWKNNVVFTRVGSEA